MRVAAGVRGREVEARELAGLARAAGELVQMRHDGGAERDGSRQQLLEAEERDALDLGQRGGELGLAVVVQAPLERGQNLGLAQALDGDDEGKAEARPVGVVEPGEGGALRVGQPVEPGRGLLAGRIRR